MAAVVSFVVLRVVVVVRDSLCWFVGGQGQPFLSDRSHWKKSRVVRATSAVRRNERERERVADARAFFCVSRFQTIHARSRGACRWLSPALLLSARA